jgi:hypothetical protein
VKAASAAKKINLIMAKIWRNGEKANNKEI